MSDEVEAILDGLTTDQRHHLSRLRGSSAFLGSGLNECPRVTAMALERRALIERDGSKVKLTDLGQKVADLRHSRLNIPKP